MPHDDARGQVTAADGVRPGSTADVAGTGWLARRWMRARWLAVVPFALIVAVGTTATMVALAAADRTAGAYRDHLRRANVSDVVINPSLSTAEIDEVIRALPDVEQVTSAAAFTITNDDGDPRPRGEVMLNQSTSAMGVMGSHDGRFVDMDRPLVVDGRMATGTREAVLTVEAAEAEGLGIGDTVSLAFWRPGLDAVAFYARPGEAERIAAEVVEPIGVEQVEIVGIVRRSDEVLPDDLYPRQLLIVSPDVAARYDCTPASPQPGSTLAESAAALLPEDCAKSYRYYSLKLAGGARSVKPVLDAFLRRSAPMNVDLANISDLVENAQEPPQYYLIPTELDQERQRVEQAVRPTVTALRVLGAAAATVTIALCGFAIGRELRRVRSDQRQWFQLGVGTIARAVVLATPLLLAVVAGAAFAIGAGWFLDRGPVGLLDVLEPDSRRSPATISLVAVAGIVIATVLIAVALAFAAARRAGREPTTRAERRHRLLAWNGAPAVTTGLAAAVTARTAPPMIAGATLMTGALVAALVFGASLSALVSTPRSYGWPWDVAAITGAGYGDLDLDSAERVLGDDPDVADWTALGLLNEVSLNGEPMMSVIGFDRASAVDLPVLDGELPHGRDEVAIGAAVARSQGLAVGDSVELGGVLDGRRATVSGIVVFPTLGPYMADTVGTGKGLLLSDAAFEDLGAPYGDADVRDLATFAGVTLHGHARDSSTVERIRTLLATLDRSGSPVFDYPTPVRPAAIIDTRSTRVIPIAVGAVFAVVIAVGLVFNAWSSTRTRSRELSVLRALGLRGADVRRSVYVQSVATMAGALVLGVPLGVIVGRVLWRAFADELGVVPDPASPWGTVAATVAGGLVLALIAAWVPARLATRSSPAAGLRTE